MRASYSAMRADPRHVAFQVLLNMADLVVTVGRSALLSSDSQVIQNHLRTAEKYYFRMIRHTMKPSLTVEDVAALEAKSIRMESIISELEAHS
jgi:hypothetical protein